MRQADKRKNSECRECGISTVSRHLFVFCTFVPMEEAAASPLTPVRRTKHILILHRGKKEIGFCQKPFLYKMRRDDGCIRPYRCGIWSRTSWTVSWPSTMYLPSSSTGRRSARRVISSSGNVCVVLRIQQICNTSRHKSPI